MTSVHTLSLSALVTDPRDCSYGSSEKQRVLVHHIPSCTVNSLEFNHDSVDVTLTPCVILVRGVF